MAESFLINLKDFFAVLFPSIFQFSLARKFHYWNQFKICTILSSKRCDIIDFRLDVIESGIAGEMYVM